VLKLQVAVYGDEDIKLLFCEPEQSAIFDSRPTHFRHGTHLIIGRFPLQAFWQTLVK